MQKRIQTDQNEGIDWRSENSSGQGGRFEDNEDFEPSGRGESSGYGAHAGRFEDNEDFEPSGRGERSQNRHPSAQAKGRKTARSN